MKIIKFFSTIVLLSGIILVAYSQPSSGPLKVCVVDSTSCNNFRVCLTGATTMLCRRVGFESTVNLNGTQGVFNKVVFVSNNKQVGSVNIPKSVNNILYWLTSDSNCQTVQIASSTINGCQ